MAGKQINIRLMDNVYAQLERAAIDSEITPAQMAKGIIEGVLFKGVEPPLKPEEQESPHPMDGGKEPYAEPAADLSLPPTEEQRLGIPDTAGIEPMSDKPIPPEPDAADVRDAQVLNHFAETMDDNAAMAKDQAGVENVVSVELNGIAYMARVLSRLLVR